MEGTRPPRPLTHDLIKTVIDALGGTITEVFIYDLKDETFFARLQMGPDLAIDARPSDAIALALRFGANIFVSEEVMEQAGFLPKEGEDDEMESEGDEDASGLDSVFGKTEEPEPTKAPERPRNELELLEQRLAEAIKLEDYEKAAKIRDDIRKLTAE